MPTPASSGRTGARFTTTAAGAPPIASPAMAVHRDNPIVNAKVIDAASG